jgi:hypothetical protein
MPGEGPFEDEDELEAFTHAWLRRKRFEAKLVASELGVMMSGGVPDVPSSGRGNKRSKTGRNRDPFANVNREQLTARIAQKQAEGPSPGVMQNGKSVEQWLNLISLPL